MSSSDPPPVSPRKEKSNVAKFFSRLATVFGIIIGLLASTAGVLAYWPDTKLQDDSDLIPRAEEIVPSEQNPAAQFEAISGWELTDEDKERMRIKESERSEDDWEYMAALIQREAETLDLMRRSADTPGWKHHIEYAFEFESPHLFMMRTGMVLLKQNSMVLLRKGKTSEAIDEAVTILKFAKRIEEGGGNLIFNLVSIAGSRIGKSALIEILENAELNPEQLEFIASEISANRLKQENFADSFRVEYQSAKEMFRRLDEGKIDIRSIGGGQEIKVSNKGRKAAFFQLNRTTNSFAEAARKLIEDAESYPVEEIFEKEVMEKVIALKVKGYWMFVSPNAVGNVLFCVSTPAYNSISHSHAHTRTIDELLLLNIAARRFSATEGRPIQSLQELVPKYIERIPTDPFDGKPIRFNPESRTAYSIGSDFNDEGGQYSNRRGKLPHEIKEEPALQLP